MCAYSVLLVTPEEKGPLGEHWRVCDDNIKIGFQEIGWGHGQD